MDADDIAEPTRLEKQIAYLESNPRVGLCGTHVSHVGDPPGLGRRRYFEWLNSLRSAADLERERYIECPIAHPTFMMRREAFDVAGGYQDNEWPEDYDLLLRIQRAGWKLGTVPEPLLQWRHSCGRLSMTDRRYAPEQFRAVKRHHLVETVLDDNRPFYQWGAGEVGKPWLREWGRHAPIAAVDINPRKIGKRIHGIPIVPPEELPPPGHATIFVAVGAPGARDDIRAWLNPRGYKEGSDYLFVA
jgi:cellulose synthase/poly-beta-1,6-N-acetylglucosamine synthase-like glycosyltransferase